MQKFFVWVLVLLGLVVLLTFALSSLTEARAERAYARAAVIASQGQSRLDTLAGISGLIAVAIPWGVILLIAGFVVLVVVLAIRYQPPRRIERIETHFVYILAPGQSRREMWQQLSRVSRRVQLIKGGNNE